VYNGPESVAHFTEGIEMFRLFVAGVISLFLANESLAQCGSWNRPYLVPLYPMTPQVWGAPRPAPTLPVPKPFVPKPGVGVTEDADPPKPREVPKLNKESDPPKIPKPKRPIPLDPDELDGPKPSKKDAAKKEPLAKGKEVEQYFVPADEKRSETTGEVRVGFFNHSDREITLDVNGEALKLPSEQYVTVRVPRTFSWTEKGQKAREVVVPPDAEGMEIVFRK
jgi:hypothetical protein